MYLYIYVALEFLSLTLNKFTIQYLINRKQQTSINNTLSNDTMISYGVSQGSVLGPLLFLIYINDLNEAISHSLIHHFAYDTNILFSNKSLKKISKYNNHDLAQIVQWLRAKRISLDSNKTEIILFWPNFRVSGQKIEPVKQTKYLCIYLDEHLT